MNFLLLIFFSRSFLRPGYSLLKMDGFGSCDGNRKRICHPSVFGRRGVSCWTNCDLSDLNMLPETCCNKYEECSPFGTVPCVKKSNIPPNHKEKLHFVVKCGERDVTGTCSASNCYISCDWKEFTCCNDKVCSPFGNVHCVEKDRISSVNIS